MLHVAVPLRVGTTQPVPGRLVGRIENSINVSSMALSAVWDGWDGLKPYITLSPARCAGCPFILTYYGPLRPWRFLHLNRLASNQRSISG